jgi:hypothetical protein
MSIEVDSHLEIGVVIGGYVVNVSRPLLEDNQVVTCDGDDVWIEGRLAVFQSHKTLLRFIARWLRDVERAAVADRLELEAVKILGDDDSYPVRSS